MNNTEKTIITEWLRIPAGKAPVSAGDRLLSPDIIIHVDDSRFRGITSWTTFVEGLNAFARLRDRDLAISRFFENPDGTITVYGRWSGVRRRRPVTSSELSMTCRIDGTLVTEIWTSRENYRFVLGSFIRFRPLWLALLAVMSVRARWRRVTRQG